MTLAVVSLADMAEDLRDASSTDIYRAAIGFVGDLASAGSADVAAAIAEEPELTGNQRLDVIVAAVAEHVAFHRGLTAPPWCVAPERFLRTAWFPVDLPVIRVRALVSSPASFARRAIFIDRSDLDRP